jgi:tRNA-2-methylthio-N6-dimethylallyladenosine synthase
MNRRYTRDDYLAKAAAIRAALPDATLSTDILVGFPGETDADHSDTLDLLRCVGFSEAFMYYYNPRTGTPAASYPSQVPLEVKKARLQEVIDSQLAILRADMAARIGDTVTVLVEGVSDNPKNSFTGGDAGGGDAVFLRARSAQNYRVVFPGDPGLVGTFTDVTITALAGNTFRGTPVKNVKST